MYFRNKVIILLLISLVYFSSSIYVLISRWLFQNSYYSHAPLVAAAFLWLLFRAFKTTENREPSYYSGIIIIFSAVIFDIAGRVSHIATLQYLSIYIFITGITVLFFGRKFLRQNFMIFVYLLLAIPLPGFLLDTVTFNLKIFSAGMSEKLLSVIYPSVYRNGAIIFIRGYYIEITPACSGMENIFSMVSLLWFFALIQKRRAAAWADYLLSVPAAVLSNVLRIIIVSVLTVNGYGKFALEDFHEGIGLLIFFIILIPVLIFNDISFRDTFSNRKRESINKADTENNRVNLKPVITVMAIFAFISVALQVKSPGATVSNYPLLKEAIAKETANWTSVDEELEESYFSMLKTDDILMRKFIRKGSSGEEGKVYLYFVHARGDRGPFLHRPELCLQGEGYNLVEQSEINAGGVPVTRMLFFRNGKGLLVYYWYSFNGRLLNDYLELQRALVFRLNRNYRCIMFRLSKVVSPDKVSDSEKILLDFAENEMPEIIKGL
ncbi:MAG TPA: EpsI family protein [Spirochaetota bacterium]|nr:EpsI family protein [Spirochaetota bacterium]